MKSYKPSGFTLIEVLIALMILAISLTAIVKASSSDIQNTSYLKDKAVASLVAINAFHLIQMGAIAFSGTKTEQKTVLANKEWFWQAYKDKTKTDKISQVTLTVSYNHQVVLTTQHYLLENAA